MPEDKNNTMVQEFQKVIESMAQLAADAQRARSIDAFIRDRVVPSLGVLAAAPIWKLLRDAVVDATVEMLENDAFSPCDAAKPARHLLQSLETVETAGRELQRWSTDDRFKKAKRVVEANHTEHTIMGIVRYRTAQEAIPPDARIPAAEVVEQLSYLSGLLSMAGQQVALAAGAMRHGHDPRVRIIPEGMEANLPKIEADEYFIPLQAGQYTTVGDRGLDLLTCLVEFGKHLTMVAVRGRERVRAASIDDKAFSPSVVAAEIISLTNTVKNAQATCLGLAMLTVQSIDEVVN